MKLKKKITSPLKAKVIFMKYNRDSQVLEIWKSQGHALDLYHQIESSKQIDEIGIYCRYFTDEEREPQGHSWAQEQGLANVFLYHWNPLMVFSQQLFFTWRPRFHRCGHEGFPCRRKASRKSVGSLFLFPQWHHNSQGAWTTPAFLAALRTSVGRGTPRQQWSPLLVKGWMRRRLRGSQSRPGHTSCSGSPWTFTRSVTLDKWQDSLGLRFLRWKEEVISPSSLGRYSGKGGRGGGAKEPRPIIGDQAGREKEKMWGSHGPDNGLTWNLQPGEGGGDGVRGSGMWEIRLASQGWDLPRKVLSLIWSDKCSWQCSLREGDVASVVWFLDDCYWRAGVYVPTAEDASSNACGWAVSSHAFTFALL